MSAKQIQYFISAVFFVLGGWALLLPQSVIDLGVRPEFQQEGRIAPFAIACFGAQAMISGLFAAFSRFTRTTFLAYAIGLVPFFIFDVWFTWVDPALTPLGGIVDGIGNIIMLALCVVGYRTAERA